MCATAAIFLAGPAAAAGPAKPTGLTVVYKTATTVLLSWSSPSRRFVVLRDGKKKAVVRRWRYTFIGLECGHSYLLGVRATANGKRSRIAARRVRTKACAAGSSTSAAETAAQARRLRRHAAV